ncbi:hypothetical protein ACUNWD_15480 [Sunxiuqinia sp. A32]|uniref:hypothetical protein n=1 Tax=Sunxiuqinia sp. A32 TaxID=3461496 RepID=UPI004045B9BF
METIKKESESFSEKESLQVIKEMINVSKSKLRKDGILFILWGWIFVINYFFLNYLTSIIRMPYLVMDIVHALRIILPLVGLAYSGYYIFQQRKKVKTYIGISLRYVWISLFICLSLVNMIQFNVLHSINFELQHPIFMVFIAFAITVTGGILRYNLIIIGGVIFALLAYTSSYFELQEQLLLESIAWLIAFVIPGHILYANRKK